MMIINKDTKISEILKENMDAVDAIATINKNFLKLKNPFLRKMLAPRVTVASAVQIGNSRVNILLKSLEEIGFQVEYDKEDNFDLNNNEENISNMNNDKTVDLDVRPVLDAGTDPFNVIMETLKSMNDDETLKIINTFEPIPLLNILKGKGYEYKSERPVDGVVHTFLWKAPENKVEEVALEEVDAPDLTYEDLERKYDGRLTEIDVRDLEMPMPMVTILEAIETLEEGHALYVHHKRLPQYLLPELKEREFDYKAQEVDEDNMKLIIFRK